MTNITIDEKTKIPLFVAITATATISGFVFWLSMIYSTIATATDKNAGQDEAIKANAAQIKIIMDGQNKMLSDLRLIKDKLKIKD